MTHVGRTFTLAMLIAPSLALAIEGPAAVVRAFYKTPLVLGTGGIPEERELQSIAHFLANDLGSRIRAAKKFEVACAKIAPSQTKPPIWEGGFFSWNTEGATRLVSAREIPAREFATVVITLEHIDHNFPVGHRYRTHAWALDIKMVEAGDRWVIADIIDEQGSTLKDELYKFSSLRCGA